MIIKIGSIVRKKSGKKFKNKEEQQKVVAFSVNQSDPHKRVCVVFSDETICNIDLLEVVHNKSKSPKSYTTTPDRISKRKLVNAIKLFESKNIGTVNGIEMLSSTKYIITHSSGEPHKKYMVDIAKNVVSPMFNDLDYN